MPAKSIEHKMADQLDAQKKRSDEIAQLKPEHATPKRAATPKRERHMGRLALAHGLGELTDAEVVVRFRKGAHARTEKG